MLKSNANMTASQIGPDDEEVLIGEHQLEEQQIEVEEIVERVVYPERVLKKEEVSVRLSHLGKTAGGDCYSYLKASCTGMGLTNISALQHFKYLQYVDVSNNCLYLEDLQCVTELAFLVSIQADNNVLYSAALKPTKFLQVMVMNHNKIGSVEDVYQPELSTLEAGYNIIRRVFFTNVMPQIRCLNFRYNLIEDIIDFDFPNLDSLYLAGNKLKSLAGLEKMVNLRILHVRNNPIRLLDGFGEVHKKLKYVNLRNCKVATLRQVKKLRVLPALEILVMKGCPYMGGTGEETAEVAEEEEASETRIEVLAALQRVKRLNRGVVTAEERNEAKDLMMQWLEEGENEEEEIEDEQAEEQWDDD